MKNIVVLFKQNFNILQIIISKEMSQWINPRWDTLYIRARLTKSLRSNSTYYRDDHKNLTGFVFIFSSHIIIFFRDLY